MTCNGECAEEIIDSIISDFGDGYLRTGDDDSLSINGERARVECGGGEVGFLLFLLVKFKMEDPELQNVADRKAQTSCSPISCLSVRCLRVKKRETERRREN